MIREAVLTLPSVIETLASEKRPVFLYGMGNGAEKIHSYLSRNGIEICGVVASDGFLRGQEFSGFKVSSICEAEKLYGSLCLVLCFGLEGEKSHFLKDIAKKHRIISPNLPVFGEGVCDKAFISENIEKFERVYSLLADDISREIFISLLKYNVTGDISYLSENNCFEAPKEFYSHSLRHIDVGAYDGDTAVEYARLNEKYSDIIAFEPDKNTFRKLKSNTSHIRSIICENALVGAKNGKELFSSGNGRASHRDKNGDFIDCVSIDSYCGYPHISANGTPVGSIKIDAEGMDEEVICGAVNTIYACKCHLCVALYHRASDIIDLPLLLRSHNSRYRFYLRKKEYVPAWDVFIYAVNK